MRMEQRARSDHKNIELKDDQLIFRFPGVHSDALLAIDFQRTLRIPDDNRALICRRGSGEFR